MFRTLAICSGIAMAIGVVGPPAASAISSYCSPSGDFCTKASKKGGVRYLALSTFSHRGRVRACVDGPASGNKCRSFRLHREKYGIYEIKVRWSRHFKNEGRGTYKVGFYTGGYRLGPRLSFRVG